MATIDDKVVAMSFESSKFESGVNNVLSGLDKLKRALHFPDAGKGLNDINAAGQKVDLSHISRTLDDIKGKFSAMSVAALAVFATIATRAVSAGAQVAKAFTIDPIIQGFHEYETQLNAIQTILSNTAAAGTDLQDVNKALDELNTYADKTIYNFSQMTKNIGTFTAAGVDLQTAVGSIKGIANLAALSGSNAEQASMAMYQLSQAISSGRVSLQDWNSVVNAGMGGTVFQRALAQTAEKMGTLSEGAVTLKGKMKNVSIEGKSFRESIQAKPGEQSWLTSEVLTATLEQLSGDLTDAQLKAQGFSAAQIKAIQAQAKMATNAATQVKTFSQLIDTTKEAVGSGWAKTWQIIFGNFGEAKRLFTSVSNSINDFVTKSANARNKILQDWKNLGGRTLLIASLRTAFKNLGEIIAPIKDAFRDIFPRKTGQDLFDLTKRFNEFAKALKPSPQTVENLRRTFRGFFAALDIGKQIIGGIFTVFSRMVGALGAGNGGFLNLTGSIGDFLVSIDNALKKGGKLHNYFATLGDILAKPIELISDLAGALGDLFATKASGGVSGAIGGLGAVLEPARKGITALHDAWTKFIDDFTGSTDSWSTIASNISSFFGNIGTNISNAISSINWDAVLSVINTGLFASLVLIFKKFFGKGTFTEQFGGGILTSLSGMFEGLSGSVKTLQQNVKANTLKQIAIAIGILALSLLVLSTIEPKKMNNALTAMTFAFGELIGAMALLDKVVKSPGFLKMPVIAAALIGLSIAIGILGLAVKGLSGLDWNQLAKGLTGVGVLLGGLAVASGPLSRNSAGMITAGIGITAIAIAMKILASAVQDFGGLSWTALAKGIGSVSIALASIGGAAKLFPKNMIAIGAGLILVGASLKIIASAVKDFGSLNWESIGKGMASIGGALLIIAGAMQLMPATMVLQAAGLIGVGVALNIIAKALQSMGGMSISEIAKGLGALAGSLLILAGALYLMQGAVGGAAALAIAAAGLALLAPALKSLGKQSWGQILKGLVSLAAALLLIGGAAALLQPVIPAMIGLGAALVLIGGGLALAGVGIALIGVGLTAIAVSGPTAIAILLKAFTDFMNQLPTYLKNIVTALVAMVTEIGNTAPQWVAAVGKILVGIANAVVLAAPQIAKAFDALIVAALGVLVQNTPKIVAAGFQMLMSLLIGIRNNIPRIVVVVTQIIAAFLNSLAANLGRVISAAGNLIVSIITGISANLNKVVAAGVKVVTSFVTGIGNNAAKIVTAAANAITTFITAIGDGLNRIVTAGANLIVNFVTGLGKNATRILNAGVAALSQFIRGIGKAVPDLVEAGARAIIDMLNGIADVIDQYEPQIIAAGARIGVAMVQGIINGIGSMAGALYNKMTSLAGDALGWFADKVGVGSPAREFHKIGVFMVQGLVNGIDATAPAAKNSMISIATGIIKSIEDIFQITSPSKVMQKLGEYVGAGFAQGLTTSTSDIQNSFNTLNAKINESMAKFRQTIATEQDKIDKLREAKKPDTKAIAEAQHMIDVNQGLLNRAKAAHVELTKGLSKERAEMLKLSVQYQDIAAKVDEARRALEDAIRVRDDASKSISDKFSATPAIVMTDADGKPITPAEQLANYQLGLQNQASAVSTFAATLEQLRALGLDDKTYQKLLDDGTMDQAFASQLLAGGKTAVDSLNLLDTQLDNVSKNLGTAAGTNLYQAGVDAKQKLLDGLLVSNTDGNIKQITERMNELARIMVKAIKKALKIKSPSEVFAEIGALSMEGLAKGFDDSSKLVTTTAENVSTAAVDAMKKSMSDLSDMVTTEINAQPTITPILDLTQVQQDSQKMADMLNSVTAAASLAQASSISTDQAAADAAPVDATPTSIKFEQNNYSPESLSAIEIYRQTKNQLAQAQLALA